MSEDRPVLFAESDELLVLDLIVLDCVVQLAFRRVLVRGLLLCILDHKKTLADSNQLVLEHDHTLKVHLLIMYQRSANRTNNRV